MAHSDCGWTCGCAGKTVKSLENACHTWALAEVNNNITPAHGTSTDFRLPLRESVQSDLAEPKYTAWNDRRTPFPAHRYADIRDVTEFGVGFIFKSDGLWRFSCNPTNSLKDYGQNRICFVARCELKCCTVTSAMNAGIDNLKTRREHLTEQFFLRNVLNEKSSLHYLLSLSLSAAQPAWRQHCEQTSPRTNIWTITNSNWKIQKIIIHPIQTCTFPIAFTVAIRCLIDYLF